jgi:hypothetical protein
MMIESVAHGALIRQILWSRAQEEQRARSALELISEPAADEWERLSAEDIEYICQLLVIEFTSTGLDSDQEPNLRGMQIEVAIDWLRSKKEKPAN